MADGKLILWQCITKAVADINGGRRFGNPMVTRAYNCLMRNKIFTAKQFSETTDESLMLMRHAGKKTYEILTTAREIAKQKYEFARENNKESYLRALKLLKDLFEKSTDEGIFVEHVTMSIN